MKLYTEEDLIDLVESLKNYTKESHNILGYDERDAKEFVYVFLKDRISIELPSDEEIESYLKSFPYTKHLDDGQYNDGVIVGAELAIEWMKDKIQGGNK